MLEKLKEYREMKWHFSKSAKEIKNHYLIFEIGGRGERNWKEKENKPKNNTEF